MTKSFVYITESGSRNLEVNSGNNVPDANFLKNKLVYFEVYNNSSEADERRRTIQSWNSKKKEFLVNFVNPEWKDWKGDVINLAESNKERTC